MATKSTLLPWHNANAEQQHINIVFLHANGYPPASYRSFLTSLGEHFRVFSLEHRPLRVPAAPTFLPWKVYAQDAEAAIADIEGPIWLVGHSMGAVMSMLLALAHPRRFRGLVAIDPVILAPGVWAAAKVAQWFRPNSMQIVRTALGRPGRFESSEAAFGFYRGKRVFNNIDDVVLWDYVHAAHAPGEQGVQLRWSGEWEACVYRSAPLVWHRLKHISVPTLGIVGKHSNVLTPSVAKHWKRSSGKVTLETLDAGHLVPLEQPAICARLASLFIQAEGKHS
jgi:pimeloyl-ACP methyl ester carboxylesterase